MTFDLYVPHGHLHLHEMMIRAGTILRPHLPIRSFATREIIFNPPLDADEEATVWMVGVIGRQIRWSLAEGHLDAIEQEPSGELVSVRRGFWRTDSGAAALSLPSSGQETIRFFAPDVSANLWLADVQHWFSTDLRVRSVEVSGALAGSPGTRGVVASIAAKSACQKWLVRNMLARNRAIELGKKHVWPLAKDRYKKLSKISFYQVWRAAAEEAGRPDLSSGGRKSGLKIAEGKQTKLID